MRRYDLHDPDSLVLVVSAYHWKCADTTGTDAMRLEQTLETILTSFNIAAILPRDGEINDPDA
jgi:hypothetical protein